MSAPHATPRTRVQRFGRDTSWEAALLQTPERTAPLYRAIYHCLRCYGALTDEELLRHLDVMLPVTPSGARSRRDELVKAGWVTEARDSKGNVVKRRGSNGTNRIVWCAVAPYTGGQLEFDL